MFELIRDFPKQLLHALELGEKLNIKIEPSKPIKNIVVCGLGGSGIGADLVAEILRDTLSVPLYVNKGYFLPGFVDEHTLLVLSSYSGNTEETISNATQAVDKKIKPIIIATGGRLEEIAIENNFHICKIPSGKPPRASLGYSTVMLFYVLHHAGLINDSFKNALARVANFLEEGQTAIMRNTEFLAAKLLNKIVVVYAEDKYASTALRLKQQINENSKMYCWYNVVPEMNHNELVGWREPNENLSVVFLRTDDEFPRNTHRILYKKDVIVALTNNVFEVDDQGIDTYEKHFYLIHFGDWLSYHLAVLQGVDPMDIKVIDTLKEHLGKM